MMTRPLGAFDLINECSELKAFQMLRNNDTPGPMFEGDLRAQTHCSFKIIKLRAILDNKQYVITVPIYRESSDQILIIMMMPSCLLQT